MPRGQGTSRLAGRATTAAIAAACLLPSVAGAAVLGPKHHGALSPTLAELAKPSVRSKPPARQAAIIGVAESGPGSLIRDGKRVLVDIRFEHGAIARLRALHDAGATVIAASRRYQTVTAGVAPAALPDVAGVTAVNSVAAVPAPLLFATECEGGSVISEGVAQMNAKIAREKLGVDGAGVTVGVLSDSYDKATEAVTGGAIATKAAKDVETADLPGTKNPCTGQQTAVDVVEEFKPGPGEESFDEGRAMLQTVHDVAPGASLAFASAFNGEVSFAQNIEKLAKPTSEGGAGAKVIVDDIAYFEEPFFQDGPVAAAVNEVVGEGATYLSAAGNDNLFDAAGREIASWEASGFRDAGSCPAVIAALPGFKGSHCMDFAPGSTTDTTFGISVEPEETLIVDLQWAEPWFGVGTDLDAFLLDGGGGEILTASFEDNPTGSERPVEILQWSNPSKSTQTVQLAVNRYSGAAPRLKFILLQNGGGVSETEYPASTGGDEIGPTIFGHSGSASAISVGAVRFSTTTKPESYSSRGPVTHYFGEVSGTIPAPPLGSAQLISKPDVVATDCGATTFFAFFVVAEGKWRFCGTSDAAPHAAGVVALMLQAAEGVGGGLEEPGPIHAALLESAVPVGSFGPCAVGAGLVEATGAVERLLAGPEPVSLGCEPPVSPPVGVPSATPLAVVPPPPPPSTFFSKRPPKTVRTRHGFARVVFRFGSDQEGVTFRCRLDGASFHSCPERILRNVAVGRHVIRVKARNSAGGVDATPAVFRFRVERVG